MLTQKFFAECQGGSIAWKMHGEVAYICHQRGGTWTTSLHLALESVGACMATQRGKVLAKRNRWRDWKQGHSAGVYIRVAEGTVRNYNAGHLSTTEKSAYTHTTDRKKAHSYAQTQSYSPLFIPAFHSIVSPFLHQGFSQTNSRSGINNGALHISSFNVRGCLSCCHLLDE